MSLPDQPPPPSGEGKKLSCPDCDATLTRLGGDGDRPATDGGERRRSPVRRDDYALRGVDVRCERCDAEIGIYLYP